MKRAVGFAAGFVVAALSVLALDHFAPRDDSDPPGGRSGFNIYTDALTGCQYLALPFRSHQPRMGADGKQVCRQGGKP